MNNSSANTFKILLLLQSYHKHCQAVLAATGMNAWVKLIHVRLK